MTAIKNHPIDLHLKNEIREILQGLHDKLTGDVLAFRHLTGSIGDAASTRAAEFQMAQLYCDESFTHWEEKFSKNHKDWVACHHLAIMHHAKAFNLENDRKPGDAHHHWIKAQEFWKVLAELEPFFSAIHDMLVSLRHYKPEKHAVVIDNIAPNLGVDILRLHGRLAKAYVDRQQPQNAKYHLLAIKRSPFACAEKLYATAYENLFGRVVSKRIETLKSRSSPRHMIEQRPELEGLSIEIRKHYPSNTETFPLAKDLLRIDVWLFKINYADFSEWLGEINLQLKGKSTQIEQLEADILAFKEKQETGHVNETEFISIKRKAERHDRIVREHTNLIREIRQKYKNFIPRAEKIERRLRELLNFTEHLSLDATEVELREVILECRLQGAEDWEEYKKLDNIYNRIQQFLNRNTTGNATGDSMGKKGDDRSAFELWPSSIYANKQNPYANTCFLLFGVEPPIIKNETNLESIVKKIRKQRRRLSNLAQRNRLIVLERKISKADLNVALEQTKKPQDMLRHILFQHQAHSCDVSSEEEKLAQMPLPAAPDLPLAPTPGIYDYLPKPRIEFKERLKLDPDESRSIEILEPDIEWPV